jgi:hypothetical protein
MKGEIKYIVSGNHPRHWGDHPPCFTILHDRLEDAMREYQEYLSDETDIGPLYLMKVRYYRKRIYTDDWPKTCGILAFRRGKQNENTT